MTFIHHAGRIAPGDRLDLVRISRDLDGGKVSPLVRSFSPGGPLGCGVESGDDLAGVAPGATVGAGMKIMPCWSAEMASCGAAAGSPADYFVTSARCSAWARARTPGRVASLRPKCLRGLEIVAAALEFAGDDGGERSHRPNGCLPCLVVEASVADLQFVDLDQLIDLSCKCRSRRSRPRPKPSWI
jgi:hypothetical protein